MADKGETEHTHRKRRTRAHVIADLSENHLEKKVLRQGYLLRRPERDYGVDVTMFHFSEAGYIENGEVRFQLKATDNLQLVDNGDAITFPVRSGDLHYWALEIYPFVLILFDATKEISYWLDIQEYVKNFPDVVDPDRETVSLRIPISNKLTVRTIEHFRHKSLQVVDQLRKQGRVSDGSS